MPLKILISGALGALEAGVILGIVLIFHTIPNELSKAIIILSILRQLGIMVRDYK